MRLKRAACHVRTGRGLRHVAQAQARSRIDATAHGVRFGREPERGRDPVGRRKHRRDREEYDVPARLVDAVPPQLRHEGSLPLEETRTVGKRRRNAVPRSQRTRKRSPRRRRRSAAWTASRNLSTESCAPFEPTTTESATSMDEVDIEQRLDSPYPPRGTRLRYSPDQTS